MPKDNLQLTITQDQAEFLSELLTKKRQSGSVRAKAAKARKTRRMAQDDEALAEAMLTCLQRAGYNGLPSEQPKASSTDKQAAAPDDKPAGAQDSF